MTDAERIYQLMALTARSDETIDPREARVMTGMVEDTPELHGISNRAGLVRAAWDMLERKGLITAVREIATPIADAGARLLAVRSCARVLAADGVVAGAELEVMGQLRRTFGYSVEEIEEILKDQRLPPPR